MFRVGWLLSIRFAAVYRALVSSSGRADLEEGKDRLKGSSSGKAVFEDEMAGGPGIPGVEIGLRPRTPGPRIAPAAPSPYPSLCSILFKNAQFLYKIVPS